MRRLLLLLVLAGCEAEAPRGTFEVHPELASTARSLVPSPRILFLNRCAGGCTLYPGGEDSRTDHSSIVNEVSTISEFSWGNVKWKQTLRCVQKLYEPFEIQVTDRDPGDVPHVESIVAGFPSEIGRAGIGGIAPFACEVVDNGINFSFAGQYENPIALCNTVGQESGHTYGLDHQMLCDDPMTYLPSCGTKAFQRVDAQCGEFDPRECYCGGRIQNSYLGLLKVLGKRVTPVDYEPLVAIVVPEDEEEVVPLFRVYVDVQEDHAVDHVELFIDGVSVGTATAAPYGFNTSPDLALGEHELLARGYDSAGQEDEDHITVTLKERPPMPDAGFFDAGENPGHQIHPDPDAGFYDAGSRTLAKDSGCTCAGRRPGSSCFVLFGLLLLLAPRVRRRI